MRYEKQKQRNQFVTGEETSADVHAPAANTIPQTVSAEHLPLARPGSLRAPSVPVPSRTSPLGSVKPRRRGGLGSSRRRRREQIILHYCAQGPTELAGLMGEIPKATLYRLIGKLVDSGALKQYGRAYQITVLGQRWLAEEMTHIEWNLFDHLYPPLRPHPDSLP
jgi:hypothetical protein